MLQRLIDLATGSSAVAAGNTFILRYFSDTGPVAREPQPFWRFEAASLLTAAQWIALAVMALSAISTIVLLFRSARGARALQAEPRNPPATSSGRSRTAAWSPRPGAGCGAGSSDPRG